MELTNQVNLNSMVKTQGDSAFPIRAKLLHERLKVGREYIHWIKDRIEKYCFIEGEDFTFKIAEINGRGRPGHEYMISVEMAKNLCMIENNEIGRQVRKELLEVYSQKTKPMGFIEMFESYGRQIIENMRAQAELDRRQTIVESKVEQLELLSSQESIDEKVRNSLKRAEVNVFPRGCLKLKEISSIYFRGMNQALVSQYLNLKNHPSSEYRYQGEGSEIIHVRVWFRDGLEELFTTLLTECNEVEPKSPGMKKNVQFNHPFLGRFYVPKANLNRDSLN